MSTQANQRDDGNAGANTGSAGASPPSRRNPNSAGEGASAPSRQTPNSAGEGASAPSRQTLNSAGAPNGSAPVKPSVAVSALIFVLSVAAMAYLRLFMYGHQFVALTYGLPLLLCLWHTDKRLLWAMTVTFLGMSAVKAFWLLPDPNPNDFAEFAQWVMQVVNILAVAVAVDVVIRLMARLRLKNARLAEANAELAATEEEVRQQNEELHAQAEELSQQNEELQHQSQELSQQAEELHRQGHELEQQSEELHSLNEELNEREAMLRTVLAALGGASDERQMLKGICNALVQLAGEPAASAAVVEKAGDQLVVRVHAGAEELRQDHWPFATSFAALIMAQGRTGFVDDLTQRPDLVIPEPAGRNFRSLLATPLKVNGNTVGAVEIYSLEPRHWTTHEFHMIEWGAAQCSLALGAMRLQQDLKESERRFRELFESMQEAFFVIEAVTDAAGNPVDWRYLQVNPQVERYMNLSREQLVGHTYREVVARPDPMWVALLGKVALTGQPLTKELFSPRRGHWLQVNAYSPRPRHAAVLFSDVTERKAAEEALRQSEEQLRLAALAANIGVWSWKPGTSQVVVSANWRNLFAVPAEATVSFETWRDAIHPDDRERALRELNTASEQRREFNSEYRVLRPDGALRWIVDRGRAWYDRDGRPMGMSGVNVDITKLKEAQQILARSKDELEALVAERTAKLEELVGELEHFSYSITHDMRAPLRAMQGFAELMTEACATCPQKEPREFLRRINTSAARMDALITDALSYNRAVRQELALSPVNARALLCGMIESYPELQPGHAQVELDGEIPFVLANEAGLTQCFSNLLGNAVKFAKPGQKPEIRIWGEVVQSSKFKVQSPDCEKLVRIWVEDKGIGISPMMLPRVFDMFARGHSDREGTGIGLALVRKVMDRMGGKVGVESELGKGSRFWLELQIARR